MSWKDEGEALQWLWAVEECRPFRESDLFSKHLERIATMAGAAPKGPAPKQMPDARLPYPEDSE